jgi:predicted dienelactone hydrolase
MLRIWYPALPDPNAEPVAYWEDAAEVGPHMGRLTREVIGLATRESSSDHYADIRTHSYRDVRPIAAPGGLPVLVFSHGYGLARPQANTALMEELASRGYWIASIAHTYETPAVVFEDGRVVPYDDDAISGLLKDDGDSTFFTDYAAEQDPAERDRIARRFLAVHTASSRSMKVWNADTRTVVDEIERLASGERESPFAGRLDLDRLGIFGMSFGGATAGVFCVEDARCKAGLNLDGFHYGDGMADAVVSVPFMIVSAKREGFPINDFFFRHAEGPIYHVTIDGSTHMNFTDSSISAPLMRRLGVLGEIDGQRMLQLMNTYVGAFFDHHLLGASAVLLERDSADFPEVGLESRNR